MKNSITTLHRGLFAALTAVSLLGTASSALFAAPSHGPHATLGETLAKRYIGRCRECDWHSDVFDRYESAQQACTWHTEQTAHETDVIESSKVRLAGVAPTESRSQTR